jgi:16S rRNA (uracil1498-N3)-methyltransferase
MARRRFFVGEIHNRRASLDGEDAHHLTRVLRVERGQRFEISDNRRVYLAEVIEAHKQRVSFEVVEEVPLAPKVVDLTLLMALIKFDHFEFALEKATEIGVTRFIPVVTQRCEKGLDKAVQKRSARWSRILLEASQQSRRDEVPVLENQMALREALRIAAGRRYLLDERPEAPPMGGAGSHGASVALLTGPEGGWTDAEHEQAVAAGWKPFSLGPHILRAETAAIAAAAVIFSACWADLRNQH